jgi:hypothetical protein
MTMRPIHSLTDIAHEFTFYFDHRFTDRYLTAPAIANAFNWGTLHKYDLRNTNLLILHSGGTPCPYLPMDIAAVDSFLAAGGGALVLGDFARFRSDPDYKLNALARAFGAEFTDEVATPPLQRNASPVAIETNGSHLLRLTNESDWNALVYDSNRRVVAAQRNWDKGRLLVASRGLVGRDPNEPDNINLDFWQQLLRELPRGKAVNPASRPPDGDPELTIEKDGLTIEYNEYMASLAEAIFEVYTRVCPVVERLLGVPKSRDMLNKLRLLPTGGGGYSGGSTIGIGVFWGNFPDDEFEMIELIAHEATHSWVLPHSEPMWNEGIATYVGILVNRALGNKERADARLREWLENARHRDPEMSRFDLSAQFGIPHEVAMGKSMWIWEQLRAERDDILARYFREKRAVVGQAGATSYSASDAAAVLSRALGRNVFPWFRKLGIDVDERRTIVTFAK